MIGTVGLWWILQNKLPIKKLWNSIYLLMSLGEHKYLKTANFFIEKAKICWTNITNDILLRTITFFHNLTLRLISLRKPIKNWSNTLPWLGHPYLWNYLSFQRRSDLLNRIRYNLMRKVKSLFFSQTVAGNIVRMISRFLFQLVFRVFLKKT